VVVKLILKVVNYQVV